MRAIGWLLFALSIPGIGIAPAAASADDDAAAGIRSFNDGDLPDAMRLLRRASDAGHIAATVRLAEILDAAQREAEARALYERAADAGHAGAQFGLAKMLISRSGGTADRQAAIEWLRKSAAQDEPRAIAALAAAYRRGELGLAADATEAARWEAKLREIDPALAATRAPPRGTRQ